MPSKMQFYAQMAEQAAKQITGSYQSWTSFLQTAGRLYKYPYLEEYDNYNVGVQFRNAASVSIAYALMCRCDMEPDEWFQHEGFLSVFDFNRMAICIHVKKLRSSGAFALKSKSGLLYTIHFFA